MMWWQIEGPDLPALRIKASSFDEALKKARLLDPDYCTGFVVCDKDAKYISLY